MATQSNSGFRHEESLGSVMNLHAMNFQTNTSSEMNQMCPYLGPNGSVGAFSEMSMVNNVNNHGFIQTGSCSNSSLETSLASEWSNEEQFRLENGLEKYKDKPSIMKYVKIAATLPEKTVRDVALRCRWMTRKRRKAEELNRGNRISSSKDKQVELSSSSSIPSVLPDNMASYPFSTPFTSSSKQITYEDLNGHSINLLEENVRAFSQIRSNLSSYKAHDNVDLFCQARNNLITIQNDMNNMPGLMTRMPPLPVAISDDLVATILSNSTLAAPFNRMQNGGFRMNQNPLEW
ncbi:unnamed protein product [Cochlearia groenlandica]